MNINLKDIKKYAAHLQVTGAYVAEPNPGVYGLEDNVVISSNDATSLYPTSEILSNIDYETLWGRIYDVNIIDNLINLFRNIAKYRNKGEQVIHKAEQAFLNAIQSLLKNYTTRKTVQNKSEFINTNSYIMLSCFRKISNYIVKYNQNFENFWEPKNDIEYILLKSYWFPLIENIQRLSEKNRGYSQVIIDYVYTPEIFYEKYKNSKFYIFTDINSSKTKFFELNIEDIEKIFKTKLLNPYGTLFLKHKDYLSFTAKTNTWQLKKRKIIKNEMLCLEGLVDNWSKLDLETQKLLLKDHDFKLNEEIIRIIFSKIDQEESTILWRIDSLKDFEIKAQPDLEHLYKWLVIRAQQKNSGQQGIKTLLNSGYGITGLITYTYSNPLIANSITTCGKIYGIKTFQRSVIYTIYEEQYQNQINL